MNTDGKDIVSNVWGSLQAELFSLSPGEARGIMVNCCEKIIYMALYFTFIIGINIKFVYNKT
jgi:hypothetical protein